MCVYYIEGGGRLGANLQASASEKQQTPPVQVCLGDKAQDVLFLVSASLNSFARLGEHQLHCSPQQFLSVKLLANAPCSYAPAPGQQHGCM